MKENIHISATESLSFAWTKFKEQWKQLPIASVIIGAFSWLLWGIDYLISSPYYNDLGSFVDGTPFGVMISSALVNILSVVFSVYFGYNSLLMVLRLIDGKKVEYKDIFKPVDGKFWKWLGASLVLGFGIGLIAALGIGGSAAVGFGVIQGSTGIALFAICTLITLLVVGYIGFRYIFSTYLVADEKVKTIKEAFATSSNMTEDIKMSLFGNFFLIGIICMLIILAGLIALVVGVIPASIIATWLSTIATTHIYRSVYAQRFNIKELESKNEELVEVVEEVVVVEKEV